MRRTRGGLGAVAGVFMTGTLVVAFPWGGEAEAASPPYVLPPPASGPETNVALSAHGRVLAYGARAEDEPGGAALYDGRDGASLLTLAAPDSEIGVEDKFGSAIAINRKFVVVSAPEREEVYVYDCSGALLHTLVNPGAPGNPAMSLVVQGSRIVVGAPFADADGVDAGAAYVFDARTGALLHTLSGPGAGSHFGWAVAAASGRVFVGAPGQIPNQGAAGVLRGFDMRTGAMLWSESSPASTPGDRFGASLAAHGGIVLAGAPYADIDGPDLGTAFLIRGRTGKVLRTYENPSFTADAFGATVAMAGRNVLVGAPLADAIETDTGAAHLFRRNGSLVDTLVPDPTTFCAHAGMAVAAGRGFVAVGVRDCFGDAAVHVYPG